MIDQSKSAGMCGACMRRAQVYVGVGGLGEWGGLVWGRVCAGVRMCVG